MLAFFRQKGITSIIYGGVVVGLILVFIFGFSPTAGQKLGSVDESCAARVHGSCIEPKAHRAAYRLVFSRGTGPMRQATASRIVLEGLIERELLAAEASRLGLTVSEAEITDSIFHGWVLLSLPSDNPLLARNLGIEDGRANVGFKDPKTKQFEIKTYERLVKQLTGRSPTEFREWQSRELLAAKMRDLVRAPVRVADDEALDRYMTERTTSTVRYAVVRRSWIEKYAVSADPGAVDAWAKDKTNLAQVTVPVRHILVKPQGDAPEAMEGAKKKAQDLIARIRKGEDFGALAKEHSEDPGSKDKGGQYPGEMVQQFVEPFRKTVESLAPGELAPEPTETTFGYHVIKRDPATREDITNAFKQGRSLEVAKQMAQAIMADVKAGTSGEEAVTAAIGRFGTTKPKPAPKPVAASDAGADAAAEPAEPTYTADTDPDRPQYVASSAFNQGGLPIPGVSADAAESVVKFAFSAEPGAVVAEPIRTDDGFLIVELKERNPATAEDFEKERDLYTQQLVMAKQAEALAQYVKRLREQSKSEIKIDESNVFGLKSGAGPSDDDEDDGL
jgi:peptidyl-prolyl cis-trans isomerase D